MCFAIALRFMRATDSLRLQIDRGLEAAVHAERHRGVLMRDLPRAGHAAQDDSHAYPDVGLLAVLLGSGHVAKPAREGEIAVDLDMRVGHRPGNWPVPGVEPRLHRFTIRA